MNTQPSDKVWPMAKTFSQVSIISILTSITLYVIAVDLTLKIVGYSLLCMAFSFLFSFYSTSEKYLKIITYPWRSRILFRLIYLSFACWSIPVTIFATNYPDEKWFIFALALNLGFEAAGLIKIILHSNITQESRNES